MKRFYIASAIVVIILAGGGWYAYQNNLLISDSLNDDQWHRYEVSAQIEPLSTDEIIARLKADCIDTKIKRTQLPERIRCGYYENENGELYITKIMCMTNCTYFSIKNNVLTMSISVRGKFGPAEVEAEIQNRINELSNFVVLRKGTANIINMQKTVDPKTLPV